MSDREERLAALEEADGAFAAELSRLSDRVGAPPSPLEGKPGTGVYGILEGMQRQLDRVTDWVDEQRAMQEAERKRPEQFLRAVKTVSGVLGIVVTSATILAGLTMAIVWLAKHLGGE